jgi:FlaA1/EpsC-like NDP-sugar epimerase
VNENSLVASITILGFAIAYLSMRALGTFLPGLSTSYINKILTLSRSTKQLLKLALDFILLPVCLWLAFAFRMDAWWSAELAEFSWLVPWTIIIAIPLFVRAGMYRAMVRYLGLRSIVAMAEAITLHIALLAVVLMIGGSEGFPPSVLAIYWALCLLLVAGSRLFVRTYLRYHTKISRGSRRALIFGAGQRGAELAHALQESLEYTPVAFIDDKRANFHTEIHHLPVYSSNCVEELIKKFRADDLFLAIPSASKNRTREVLSRFEDLPINIRTVPAITDLVTRISGPRQFDAEDFVDIMGRDPVPVEEQLLQPTILGKSVLVTGAGGSIGSELCRQILSTGPQKLILFDVSEAALYTIDRELKHSDNTRTEIISVLGTVTDREKARSIIQRYGVQTIYHAAAYKHVPLVEENPVAGVENNVFGTWHMANVAATESVETFVLVSTDKAVRPTNVMGASKRLAELCIQGLAARSSATRFTIVRFGNVLGSSGSVLPLFQEQIAEGGPVTITHPEVTRYFMTISEASSLVIQAASMGHSGEVFVLDMGQSVKILDLAKRLIRLAGLRVRNADNPNGDIEVLFTGLRPGEKLYEELLIGENPETTSHPRIIRAQEADLEWDTLLQLLDSIGSACNEYSTEKVKLLLRKAVAGYEPRGRLQALPSGESLPADSHTGTQMVS